MLVKIDSASPVIMQSLMTVASRLLMQVQRLSNKLMLHRIHHILLAVSLPQDCVHHLKPKVESIKIWQDPDISGSRRTESSGSQKCPRPPGSSTRQVGLCLFRRPGTLAGHLPSPSCPSCPLSGHTFAIKLDQNGKHLRIPENNTPPPCGGALQCPVPCASWLSEQSIWIRTSNGGLLPQTLQSSKLVLDAWSRADYKPFEVFQALGAGIH